jgi:hypothetical protein
MGILRAVSPSLRIERRFSTAEVVVFSLYFVKPSEGVERVPSFSYQASKRSSRARWRAPARRDGKSGIEGVAVVGLGGDFVGEEEEASRLSLRFSSSSSSLSSASFFALSGGFIFFLLSSRVTSRVMPCCLAKNLRKFSRRVQRFWKFCSMSWFWSMRFSMIRVCFLWEVSAGGDSMIDGGGAEAEDEDAVAAAGWGVLGTTMGFCAVLAWRRAR